MSYTFTLGNSTPSLGEFTGSKSAVQLLLRNFHGSKIHLTSRTKLYLCRPSGTVDRDADCCAAAPGSNPGDVYKCIVPLRHGCTINSRRAASHFVRLVDGEESWEAPTTSRAFSLKIGEELSQIVLSPVWCSKLRIKKGLHQALCRDEFREP
ncbi:hypothetical protein TNCV_4184451 [Trichonephila clavipes]|nr:hypothetical protein TNCV_4184451 [Trichonephila clavipes]